MAGPTAADLQAVEAFFSRLSTHIIKPQPPEDGDCDCPICHEPYKQNPDESPEFHFLTTTHCGHTFHTDCLRSWLSVPSTTCPYCRTPIFDTVFSRCWKTLNNINTKRDQNQLHIERLGSRLNQLMRQRIWDIHCQVNEVPNLPRPEELQLMVLEVEVWCTQTMQEEWTFVPCFQMPLVRFDIIVDKFAANLEKLEKKMVEYDISRDAVAAEAFIHLDLDYYADCKLEVLAFVP